jgi:outer membrane biosynthesis protein TonB
MREAPRRRRSDDDSNGGGGLPLVPLILIVIFAGLLLGGLLAHFFGGPRTPMTAPTAMARASITPLPSPTVAPSASPPLAFSPSPRTPHPSPSPAARPAHKPAATPTPIAQTPAPTAKPKVHPSPSASAMAEITPAPLRPAPLRPAATASPPAHVATRAVATPTPAVVAATGVDQATGVVRSYLGALARGDRTAAAGYLAHGAPNENFMDSSAHIESIRSASNGGQQYTVTADVQTSSGEYYITFTVAPGPGGMQITDHYSIKPQ